MYHINNNILNLCRERNYTNRNVLSSILLDRNERTIPFKKEVKQLLSDKINEINLCHYPDLTCFYTKLSNWLNVNEDEIFVTEGVDGAIKTLIGSLTRPGESNVIFPNPTFALYKIYCDMFNVQHITVGYKSDYTLDYENLIYSIDKNTAIVFLPNPNMPIHGITKLIKSKR